jgi:hypothetical protein
LHAERGLQPTDNGVTVFACEGPRQVRSSLNPTAEGVLTAVADCMSSLGTSMTTSGSVGASATGTRQGEVCIVIAGEHRRIIARQGWSKSDIRNFLQTQAHRSLADLKRGGGIVGAVEPGDAEHFIPVVAEPQDILVVAAGGDEGAMSAVIPSWGPKVASTAVTWPIVLSGSR